MTRNTIDYLNYLAQKEHWTAQERQEYLNYLEHVRNNSANILLTKQRNEIEKLAKDELNMRELMRLAQDLKIANDNLLEKQTQRLSNEQIEQAKRIIEQYNAETARLKAEWESKHYQNEPNYEEDRNAATIKAGMFRALGGLGALASGIVALASKAGNKTSGTSLEKVHKQLVSQIKPTAVNAAGFWQRVGASGKSLLGSAAMVGKVALPTVATALTLTSSSPESNPLNQSERQKNYIDFRNWQLTGLGDGTLEEAIARYLKTHSEGGVNNETVSESTQSNEISGDRNPTSEGPGTQISFDNNGEQKSSSGSNIIWSPGSKRDIGPAFS